MLSLAQLQKHFDTVHAVCDVTFSIERGEFIAVVGPSGCGKTTLLRLIAGFERPSSGNIFLDGRDIAPLPPQSRRIGMVFQNYALFPHMSVRENISFGLEAHHVPSASIHARTLQAAERVRLAHKLDVKVPVLSGGEQQRVAVARAIVTEPALLLLDEPLSNLDPVLREEMQSELLRVQKDTGLTTLHVTHDQAEAMALADRIIVMRGGHVEQFATPGEIYFHPANSFVASFMGGAQIISCTVKNNSGARVLEIANGISFPFPKNDFTKTFAEESPVHCAIKPEAAIIAPDGIPAIVRTIVFLGATTELGVEIAGVAMTFRFLSTVVGKPAIGETIRITFTPELCSVFPK